MCQSEQVCEVVFLSFSVSLLIYLSPSHPFKNTQHFLPSSLLGGPSPSPSPTPSLSLSSTISLLTVPLHPSSSILSSTNAFQPPVILIKPQFGTVMGICTFDKNSETTCAIQGKLDLPVCNTCHVSLSV